MSQAEYSILKLSSAESHFSQSREWREAVAADASDPGCRNSLTYLNIQRMTSLHWVSQAAYRSGKINILVQVVSAPTGRYLRRRKRGRIYFFEQLILPHFLSLKLPTPPPLIADNGRRVHYACRGCQGIDSPLFYCSENKSAPLFSSGAYEGKSFRRICSCRSLVA